MTPMAVPKEANADISGSAMAKPNQEDEGQDHGGQEDPQQRADAAE